MIRFSVAKFIRKLQIIFLYPYRYKRSFILSFIPRSIIIEDSLIIEEDVNFSDKISFIGEGTFIGSRSVVGNCSMIGKFCSISKDVKIGMVNHPLHLPFTSPRLYQEKYKIVQENLFNHDEIKPVIIENNVLISANVVIMEGLVIGQGSVIGANAVVNCNIEPYSVVAGVPSKLIRYRFSKPKINELLKLSFKDLNKILEIQNSEL